MNKTVVAGLTSGVIVLAMIIGPLGAYAATTDRMVTVNLEGKTYTFTITSYEFERSIFINVSESLLQDIADEFGTVKFVFYSQISKYESDDSFIQIEPRVNVGGKLDVKFVTESKAVKVQFGEHSVMDLFTVKPSLTNGSIKSIEADPDSTSIIISVSTTNEDGELTITLQRGVIDSRADGIDDDFIVLIDGEETDFEETDTTSMARTLKIPIPAGAEKIEIIGTHVIPEFPTFSVIIFATAMSAILATSLISKRRSILTATV